MGRRGMDMQFAELAPEGEMLLRRDVLIAEKNRQFWRRAVDLDPSWLDSETADRRPISPRR